MKKIEDFIKKLPYQKYDKGKLFIIETSNTGEIINSAGKAKQFFNREPEPGVEIFHIYPQFEGLYPFEKKQLSFPNVETKPDVYANIDVYLIDNKVFIVFEDNSYHVYKYRKDIQKANEEYLKNQTKYRILSEKEISYKEIYTEILYFLNVGVFQYDCKGNVKISGKQPEWLFKLKPELSGNSDINLREVFPFLEIFFPEFDKFCETKRSGKISSDLWTEVGSDGGEKLLQCIGIKTMNIAWILILSHDTVLTRDRKILQKAREQSLFTEQLEKAKNELQKLLDFKDQFVSIVSHDLRSPVSSVVAATDMMLSDSELKNSINYLYLEFLETINKDMKLLLDYNEKLYYWSNLQLGRFNIDAKEVNLKNLISAAKNKFENKAKDKKIRIESRYSDNLLVNADESLITQVITNLINNALKFTPPGGQITLTGDRIEDQIILSVKDTGVGIKPEILKNLFKGYVKGHTDGTNGEKGSGLGLGICKRIIDAHGFNIDVDSKVNEGTTFTINFTISE